MTEAAARCPHERDSGIRCELSAGHGLAHRARIEDDVVLSWANHDPVPARLEEDDSG